MDCLEKIVGLSPSDVPCFTGSAPVGYADSDSGYYMTDVDYGVGILTGCEIPGWDILVRARSAAIQEFKTDLYQSLKARHDVRFEPFSGLIGKVSFSGARSSNARYFGQVLKPAPIRGGKFVLVAVWVGTSSSGAVTITAKSNADNAPATWSGNAQANEFVRIPLPTKKEFDLWSKIIDEVEIRVTVDAGANMIVLNNNYKCCGNSAKHEAFATANGYHSQDPNAEALESDACGVALEGYFVCDGLRWVCDMAEVDGYEATSLAARAIQFRASAIALSEVLMSYAVSPCVLDKGVEMAERRGFLNGKYTDYINWLTDNLPASVTDCWTCKDESRFYLTSNLT